MFHSKILWQITALAFFACLSTPVQGDGVRSSFLLRFQSFMPEGTQFSSGTTIGDNLCPDEDFFKLTGGTSEIVRTDLFREGGSRALLLNGTLEKLSFYRPPSRSIIFGRESSDISEFASDFIELNGKTVSLLDFIVAGPNVSGPWDVGSAESAELSWGYSFKQLDEGGYSLQFWVPNNVSAVDSFSVSSQNPGLLVHSFHAVFLPEPSSLTILLVGIAFCGVNTRIARRLQ